MAEKFETLGQFEQLVLTATYLLRGEGYSVPIWDKVSELSEKRVMLGAVFVSLDRLQRKGLVTSWFGEATATRGGKAKRFFKVTDAGERALSHMKATAARLIDVLRDLA
jgi:PadR family transcriptional regulator PadR